MCLDAASFMASKVFLTVTDSSGFHAVLVANHVLAVRIPAGPNMHYALHGPQGERLPWPVSVKRVGDDLHVLVRHEGHQSEVDFIITDFFEQMGDERSPALTDFSGTPYVDAVQRLSDYEHNLQPGQTVDLMLHSEANAGPHPLVLGGSALGAGATWFDVIGATVSGVVSNSGGVPTIVVSAFADTDHDGQLNIEGNAIANSTLQVMAPGHVLICTVDVDVQGNFAVDIDVSLLAVVTGTYELSYLGDHASQPGLAIVLSSMDGPYQGTHEVGPDVGQLQLRLSGAALDGSEALWLGEVKVPWDGSERTGQLQVGGVAWSWQWVDGQLTCHPTSDATGAQISDVGALLSAAHWESSASADVGGTRVLDVTLIDVDGQPYAWSNTLLWGTPALAFDLNGDGHIDYTHTTRDVNGDGVLDQQGWVGAADGVLVANWSSIEPGSEGYSTDFTGVPGQLITEALGMYFDGNADSVFDAQDQWFSGLSVWQDLDQNGVVGPEELHSLSELGMDALSLTATLASAQPEALVHVGAQGLASSADGLQTWLWQDVALAQTWGVI